MAAKKKDKEDESPAMERKAKAMAKKKGISEEKAEAKLGHKDKPKKKK